MSNCGIATRHYCGTNSGCPTGVAFQKDGEVFCNKPHPRTALNEETGQEAPIARCRRQPHAEGLCSAYTFSCEVPEEWAS